MKFIVGKWITSQPALSFRSTPDVKICFSPSWFHLQSLQSLSGGIDKYEKVSWHLIHVQEHFQLIRLRLHLCLDAVAYFRGIIRNHLTKSCNLSYSQSGSYQKTISVSVWGSIIHIYVQVEYWKDFFLYLFVNEFSYVEISFIFITNKHDQLCMEKGVQSFRRPHFLSHSSVHVAFLKSGVYQIFLFFAEL